MALIVTLCVLCYVLEEKQKKQDDKQLLWII